LLARRCSFKQEARTLIDRFEDEFRRAHDWSEGMVSEVRVLDRRAMGLPEVSFTVGRCAGAISGQENQKSQGFEPLQARPCDFETYATE
jgi:hypothetical protein